MAVKKESKSATKAKATSKSSVLANNLTTDPEKEKALQAALD